MSRCPQCEAELPQRTGTGTPATYCSLRCRNRAKRRRENERRWEASREWYAKVTAGEIIEPRLITPEAALRLLDEHPEEFAPELLLIE